MDHSEAVRLHAAEKYVLGELPPTLRDQYEEHFFDCQECAADVRTAVAFAATSRAAFRSMPEEPSRESFLDLFAQRFLRPAWTAPALALLLVALAYQTFVAIPNIKQNAAPPALGSANFISLIGANSRAEGAKVFTVRPNQPIILEVDIPPSPEAVSGYWLDIVSPAGHVAFSANVSPADARNTAHLIVPAGKLTGGEYNLSVLAQRAEPPGPEARRSPVLETKFIIQVTR